MKPPVIVRAHFGMNSLSEPAYRRIWTSTHCILDIHFACCICWKYLKRGWLELKTPTPFEKYTGSSQMCPVSEQGEPEFLFGDHTFHNSYHSFIRRGTPVSLLLYSQYWLFLVTERELSPFFEVKTRFICNSNYL